MKPQDNEEIQLLQCNPESKRELDCKNDVKSCHVGDWETRWKESKVKGESGMKTKGGGWGGERQVQRKREVNGKKQVQGERERGK